MISGMARGEPGWLAAIENRMAALAAHQGLAASIAVAVVLGIIAAGVFRRPPAARATLVMAVFVAAAIWMVGEALGSILTGGATDPGSGPPLALLAVAYWPARGVRDRGPSQTEGQ